MVASSALPNLPGQTILVVDDEPHIRDALKSIIEREFPEVRVALAAAGREALDVLAREPVDVILSDHKMPGISGIELLRRAHETRPDVPRILMTAYPDLDLAIQAINLGHIETFLMKPFDRAAVLAAVEKALKTRSAAKYRESSNDHAIDPRKGAKPQR